MTFLLIGHVLGAAVAVPIIVATMRARRPLQAPREQAEELPKTEAQKKWERKVEIYLRRRFPDMVSYRILNPCSTPRSALYTDLEVVTGREVVRLQVCTYLIAGCK